MGAKLSSTPGKKSGVNIVISRKIDELTGRMLEILSKSFNIDFMDKLELRMSLNQHLVPLDIRMQFDIHSVIHCCMKLKKNMPLPILWRPQPVLHCLNIMPPGFLTMKLLILPSSLNWTRMKKDKKIEKKNIIIVCASGKGTTQLFCINTEGVWKLCRDIYECTAWELWEL